MRVTAPPVARPTLRAAPFVIFLVAACSPFAGRRELELNELRALQVPGGEGVTGVAASDDGAVAAWASDRLFLTDATRRVLVLAKDGPDVPVGAAFDVRGSRLEVLGADGRWVRLGPHGDRLGEKRFHLPVRLSSAVRTSSGWVGGGTDSTGAFLVYRMLDGAGRLLLAVARDRRSAERTASVQLAADGEEILVTDLEAPHETRVLGIDGVVHRKFRPAGALPRTQPASTPVRARWISLPVVPLGSGYLQTLSDLGSDRRVMVLYSAEGVELRRKVVDAPFAITGATPRSRLLVAARNAGGAEVVLYSWRWTPERGGEG